MDWLYWAFCLALQVLIRAERASCLSGISLLVPAPAAGSGFWVIEQQDRGPKAEPPLFGR